MVKLVSNYSIDNGESSYRGCIYNDGELVLETNDPEKFMTESISLLDLLREDLKPKQEKELPEKEEKMPEEKEESQKEDEDWLKKVTEWEIEEEDGDQYFLPFEDCDGNCELCQYSDGYRRDRIVRLFTGAMIGLAASRLIASVKRRLF